MGELVFQEHIPGSVAAMTDMGLGIIGNQRPDRVSGEPARKIPAQNPFQTCALARNDQQAFMILF